MSLKQRITDDMKAAMKAKDSARLSAVRLILAGIKQREVDERRELADPDVIQVLEKLAKQRKDSIEQYLRAQRQDLADQERFELDLLSHYLPQKMDPQAVRAAVDELVRQWPHAPGPADMGKLMAAAKTRLAGEADMADVAAALKQALSGRA